MNLAMLLERSRSERKEKSGSCDWASAAIIAPTATVVLGSSTRRRASRNGYQAPTRYSCSEITRSGGSGSSSITSERMPGRRDGRPDSSRMSQS